MKLRLSREELINILVEGDIKIIEDGQEYSDHSYINDIMRGGFKGYDQFTDDELLAEFKEQKGYLEEDDIRIIPEPIDEDTLIFTGITEEELKNISGLRRLTAMQWWNNLPPISKQMHTDENYDGRICGTLTGSEIEAIYFNQD